MIVWMIAELGVFGGRVGTAIGVGTGAGVDWAPASEPAPKARTRADVAINDGRIVSKERTSDAAGFR
jgi:hypothetical protein